MRLKKQIAGQMRCHAHWFIKMSRKSQVQMMETIVVLAVFFILITIFYAFYSNTAVDTGREKDKIRQLEAVKIMQQVSSLVELQCSERGIARENCIDLSKIEAVSEIMQKEENKEPYFDKFGFSKITITEIYPETRNLAVIYDNSIEGYSYKDMSDIPVSLFDPFKNRHYFGAVRVEMFQK